MFKKLSLLFAILLISFQVFAQAEALEPQPQSQLSPEEIKKNVMATEYYQSIIKEKQIQSEQDLPFRGFDPDKQIDTIAVGSNLNQNQPMPIWDIISSNKPDLFLFSGNTVINHEKTLKNLLASYYRKLITNREYRKYREKIPFMSIWNNQELLSGLDQKEKDSARKDFLKKWPYINNLTVKNQKGLYHSKIFSDKKKKNSLQVIMLDTRWDKTDSQILSQEQWAWLDSELKRPAGFRILVSPLAIERSTSSGSWNDIPKEKEKLLALLKKSKIKNLVLVDSSDQTSSLIQDNVTILNVGRLNKLTEGKENDPIPASFGLIKINWDTKKATIEVRDDQNQVKETKQVI